LLIPHSDVAEGQLVALDRDEARHASGALRLTVGSTVVLSDGCGLLAEATLRNVERGRVIAEIRSTRIEHRPRGEGVCLAIGVLHGHAMDWAVQKAVEVGVRSLVPLLAERSQLPRTAVSKRHEHWRRLARQGIKQCRRPWEMELADPLALVELLATRGLDGGVIADPDGLSPDQIPAASSRLLLVGPEGGFSKAEHRVLEEAGWAKVCFGRYLLRAETAAIVGSAMLVSRQEHHSMNNAG
jgi:16S rRNA (uracil1498-N3)-methyltransferase